MSWMFGYCDSGDVNDLLVVETKWDMESMDLAAEYAEKYRFVSGTYSSMSKESLREAIVKDGWWFKNGEETKGDGFPYGVNCSSGQLYLKFQVDGNQEVPEVLVRLDVLGRANEEGLDQDLVAKALDRYVSSKYFPRSVLVERDLSENYEDFTIGQYPNVLAVIDPRTVIESLGYWDDYVTNLLKITISESASSIVSLFPLPENDDSAYIYEIKCNVTIVDEDHLTMQDEDCIII